MTIEPTTGVFSWTPAESQGGLTPSVTITVTDNGSGNLTDTETFTITVGDINLAPVLAAIGNQNGQRRGDAELHGDGDRPRRAGPDADLQTRRRVARVGHEHRQLDRRFHLDAD